MARRKRAQFLTKQAPLSSHRFLRRVCIIAAAVAILLALGGVAAYVFFISWLQGEGFRTRLESSLTEAMHAQHVAVPENMTVEGRHMTLPQLNMQGARAFDNLSVRKLHIEVDRRALWDRILKLHHFSAEEAQLTVSLPPKIALDENPHISKSSFFKGFQAKSFESHYTDTHFLFGERKISLRGYLLTLKPLAKAGKGSWSITAENGRLSTPYSWLQECGVKKATLLYQPDALTLENCTVLLTPGEMRVTGIFYPESGQWRANLDIASANVARILRSDWKKRLTGSLQGGFDLEGCGPDWEAHGEIRLENGVLEGLPFLSDMQIGDTRPYRRLRLQKASCRITYPYSDSERGIQHAWLWDRIDIRSEGADLLVRGHIIIGDDGSLSGTLRVGIPAKTIADMGLANSKLTELIFNAPAEAPGYLWLHVNLSGTTDSPQEDLSVRLDTVLPLCVPELAEKAINSLEGVLKAFIPATQAPKEQDTPAKNETESSQKKPQSQSVEQIKSIINSGLNQFL